MTKKHFISIGDTFKSTRPIALSEIGKAQKAQWEYMVNAMADTLSQSNPRFDRGRWLGYVRGENGPNGGAIKP